MPCIGYEDHDFRPAALAIIDQANDICAEYGRQGFDLTLRQLYYQFVSRDLIPNSLQSYKRLGSIVNNARMAGLLDWSYIVDRTRDLESNPHWSSPARLMVGAAQGYGQDLWADQPTRVEVWIEKDALAGVIEGVCTRNDVAYFSCRGYTSQSEMWVAAQRHLRYEDQGQDVLVLHLGDHDPSGIDMTRDIGKRLDVFGASTNVQRIALNRDQVDQYRPPPNPAKLTDSRAEGYIAVHGRSSWELDALSPQVLDDLIDRFIEANRVDDLWQAAVAEQERGRTLITEAADRWDEVVDFLEQ